MSALGQGLAPHKSMSALGQKRTFTSSIDLFHDWQLPSLVEHSFLRAIGPEPRKSQLPRRSVNPASFPAAAFASAPFGDDMVILSGGDLSFTM